MPTTYALIDTSGNIVRKEEFDGEAPALAAAKGLRWVPDTPPAYDPATQITPTPVLPVTGGAVQYSVTPIPLETVRATRLAALATHRYERETGGISVNGASIRTDRESQAALAAKRLGRLATTDWKAEYGWITLDQAALEAVQQAVTEYVEACFARERALCEAIAAAADVAALIAIDITTGWPAAQAQVSPVLNYRAMIERHADALDATDPLGAMKLRFSLKE